VYQFLSACEDSNLVLHILNMSNNQEEETTKEFRQPPASNLQMQALLGEMRRMLRAELEPIHERLDRVEAETPRGQQQDNPNRQQGGCVPWRNVEEEAELEEFDEPYLNRGKFERGYGNREADVNPVKNNETQQRKGTQDRSMDRFEWKTSTHCL